MAIEIELELRRSPKTNALRIGAAVALLLFLAPAIWGQTRQPAAASNLFAGLEKPAPIPELSLSSAVADWHKDAVVYHVWVASFRDSDGDGIGDLNGIRHSLDVLRDLGVNAIWLSPFFTSASTPRNLHGYDVVDHYTVDPRLGSNEDAFAMVREAHQRGIRLIFDFVPNHLSTRHPWFVEARDINSPKREWFVWRQERPDGLWKGMGGHGAWHPSDGAWYYGIFWSGMPDVNHRHDEARLELARAARFWLDRGFDGIRMDAVRYLYEDFSGAGARSDQQDQPETIEWFESWRRDVMEPYTAAGYPKFMVAENWTGDPEGLLAYMVRNGRPVFHMTLNFPALGALTKLDLNAAKRWWAWDAGLPDSAWLGNFVSNHDMAADRPGTLFAEQPARLRAQTAWLILGPGTPFIYYGNEIGQQQGPERGDLRHRHKLNWAGIARQREDAASTWRWHQRLIQLRHQHASIRRGKIQFLRNDGGDDVLVAWREAKGDATLTVFNGANALKSLAIELPPGASGHMPAMVFGKATLRTDAQASRAFLGPIEPHEAVVLTWPRSALESSP
jgi:alpha-amylase